MAANDLHPQGILRHQTKTGRRGVDFPAPHWGYAYLQVRPRPWVRPLDAFKAFTSKALFVEAVRWVAGYRWFYSYVGITVDLSDRFVSHSRRSVWFPQVEGRGIYVWEIIDDGRPMYTREARDIWERGKIMKAVPLHNQQMNERRATIRPRPIRFPSVTRNQHAKIDRMVLFAFLAQSIALAIALAV